MARVINGFAAYAEAIYQSATDVCGIADHEGWDWIRISPAVFKISTAFDTPWLHGNNP